MVAVKYFQSNEIWPLEGTYRFIGLPTHKEELIPLC